MFKEFRLPKNLLCGVATASSQIEGGDSNSNWNDWYKKGMIRDGSDPSRANDHLTRWKEDIDLMSQMNIQIYRMSIEWSRIEPEQNVFSREAIEHYIEEISYLKSKGIKVLLTLHHFNNPLWFDNLGGFTNSESSIIFTNFVTFVIKALGNIVNEYITINEPNVYVTSAYFFGEFPPGDKSFKKCRLALTNLAKSHILTYNLIHKMRKDMGYDDTLVGYASHVRVFEPKNKHNIIDKICCKFMEQMFQTGIDLCSMKGIATFPIKDKKAFTEGKYYDFIGINYYSRSMVSFFKEEPKVGAQYNDMGWEVYPEGLKKTVESYYKKFNAPIYITENGTADAEDKIRAKFIYDHLLALTNSLVPITRYYHWTFIDNFEWMDGETQRFGLVKLDYETQKRTIRKSGYFYSEIIKNNGITDELINKYLKKD